MHADHSAKIPRKNSEKLRSTSAARYRNRCELHSPPLPRADAGWRSITTPGPPLDAPPVSVILYYPAKATERVIAMGPFTVTVALGAAPDAQIKGLICSVTALAAAS